MTGRHMTTLRLVLLAAVALLPLNVDAWGWLHDSLFDNAASVIDLESAAVQHVHADANRCPWVILFYDSMCGHCRGFAPKYGDAAQREQELPKANLPILFGAINCAAHEKACTAANITSVPTLYIGVPSQQARRIDRAAAVIRHTDREAPDPTLTWRVSERADDELPVLVGAFSSLVQLTSVEASACRAISSFALSQKRAAVNQKGKQGLTSGDAVPPVERRGTRLASFGAGDNSTSSDAPPFVEETRLHQADVGGAFYVTMMHEVPMAAASSEGIAALTLFLHYVSRSLPALGAGELHRAVSRNSRILQNPERWRQIVAGVGIPFDWPGRDRGGEAPLDEIVWHLCRGSSWKERGLPCGLWNLYHAMVINAPPNEGAATLVAIRGYVKHFFTCLECRHHFESMAFHADEKMGDNQAVLWLWDAHNQVNARLLKEGGGSSDPMVPKVLWPTPALCPTCRTDVQTWMMSHVLTFLEKHYVWQSLIPLKDVFTERESNVKAPVRTPPVRSNHPLPPVVQPTLTTGAPHPVPDDHGFLMMMLICISIALLPTAVFGLVCLRDQWRKGGANPRHKYHHL